MVSKCKQLWTSFQAGLRVAVFPVSTRDHQACGSTASYIASIHVGPGMPAGHACIAIGTWTWLMLEVWFGYGTHSASSYSTRKKLTLSLLASVICLPVPFAGIGLYDHTGIQVIFGALEGFLLGVIFYLVLAFLLLLSLLCRSCLMCFFHSSCAGTSGGACGT